MEGAELRGGSEEAMAGGVCAGTMKSAAVGGVVNEELSSSTRNERRASWSLHRGKCPARSCPAFDVAWASSSS